MARAVDLAASVVTVVCFVSPAVSVVSVLVLLYALVVGGVVDPVFGAWVVLKECVDVRAVSEGPAVLKDWVVLMECVGDRAASESAAVPVAVDAVVHGVLQYTVPTVEQTHISQHRSLPP